MQIEYALAAVAAGAPSVGILGKFHLYKSSNIGYNNNLSTASNGVVIATENKPKSTLYEEGTIHRVEMIAEHIGMVYSGMGPDYRLLVRNARKLAQNYFLTYKEPIPVVQLVQRVANLMQEYTQSG